MEVARALVEEGRPLAAHEVLEARWKAGPEAERDLWQGLARLCVGLTHAARGNAVGAARLVETGAARLERYGAGTGPTYGVDLEAATRCARERLDDRSEPVSGTGRTSCVAGTRGLLSEGTHPG